MESTMTAEKRLHLQTVLLEFYIDTDDLQKARDLAHIIEKENPHLS